MATIFRPRLHVYQPPPPKLLHHHQQGLNRALRYATITHITQQSDNTDATVYVSPSFTPAVGDLLLLITCAANSAVAAPTITNSQGITFTRVASAQRQGVDTVYLWVANQFITAATAVAQTITATYSSTALGNFFEIARATGIQNTGMSALVQFKASTSASGNPTATFDQPPSLNNPILAISLAGGNTTVTEPFGLTERNDQGMTTPGSALEYASIDYGYASSTVTWGSAIAAGWGALIVELRTDPLAPFDQSDWPLPPPRAPRAIDLLTWTQPWDALQILAASPGNVPIRSDIGGPSYSIDIQDFVGQNLLLTTLAPAQQPFSQSDWSLPRTILPSPRWTVLGSNIALLTTPPPQPFAQDDWPNPRASQRPVVDHVWSTSILYLLRDITKVPIVSDIGGPTYSFDVQDFIGQNLLLTTLAPAVSAKPFAQYDWPLPKRLAPFVEDLINEAIAQDTQPFAQNDWPLPIAPKSTPQFWTYNAMSSGLVPPAPLPFNQDDWPNPLQVKRPTEAWTYNAMSSGLVASTAKPFLQGDWPNPQIAKRPVVDHVWSTSILYLLRDITKVPIQSEIGGPTYSFDVQDFIGQNLLLTTLAPAVSAKPFAQYDWPLPKRLAPFVEDLINEAIAQDTQPFAQDDWPNPRAPKPVPQFWTLSLNTTTLSAPAPVPFAQDDWPLPPRAAPRPPQDFFASLNFKLIGQDVQFAGPGQWKAYDWPNPLIPKRAIDLSTWAYNAMASGLVPTTLKPFNQQDWPVPRKAPPPPQDWQWGLTALKTPATFALPFAQFDWSTPRQPVAAPQSWYSGLSALQMAATALPFNQLEWRVYRGPYQPQPEASRGNLLLTTLSQPIGGTSISQPIPPRQPQHPQLNKNFLLTTSFPMPPIHQWDWPLPQRAAPRPGHIAITPIALFLAAPPPKPLNQSDWPNPLRPWSNYRTAFTKGSTLELFLFTEPPRGLAPRGCKQRNLDRYNMQGPAQRGNIQGGVNRRNRQTDEGCGC